MHIERSYRTETNILFLSEVYRNIVALPVWTKGLSVEDADGAFVLLTLPGQEFLLPGV